LKHAQTSLYYDQVAWLPISRAINSFRELHSRTTYICIFSMSTYTHTLQPVNVTYYMSVIYDVVKATSNRQMKIKSE